MKAELAALALVEAFGEIGNGMWTAATGRDAPGDQVREQFLSGGDQAIHGPRQRDPEGPRV